MQKKIPQEPKHNIPDAIILCLYQMASELAKQDNKDKDTLSLVVKNNINNLNNKQIEYLVDNMNKIFSTYNSKNLLDEKNTDKKFVSFLLKLFN